jgi:hypothetical protein
VYKIYLILFFSRYTCYDTVSTYDTTLISLIINYGDTSAFCMHEMHDTSYDTTIVTSLMYPDPWHEYFFSANHGTNIKTGMLHLHLGVQPEREAPHWAGIGIRGEELPNRERDSPMYRL